MILVLGLGNVLMGDDAFGPFVIEALRAGYEFPECVTLLDGGTPGLNLVAELLDARVLIVVDTVKAKGNPGEMRLYRRSDLSSGPRGPRQNPHEPGLAEVLTALDLAGRSPEEVLLIGVIPESVATGTLMSEALRWAVPVAVEAVIDELERCGVSARRKLDARAAAPWWERDTAMPLP
jgi:hydrogenase maturation protease